METPSLTIHLTSKDVFPPLIKGRCMVCNKQTRGYCCKAHLESRVKQARKFPENYRTCFRCHLVWSIYAGKSRSEVTQELLSLQCPGCLQMAHPGTRENVDSVMSILQAPKKKILPAKEEFLPPHGYAKCVHALMAIAKITVPADEVDSRLKSTVELAKLTLQRIGVKQ